MDTTQIALNQGLTFLAWTTGIIFIIVAAFVVKLLVDLSALAKNVDETTSLVKSEIEPALKELNVALQTINNVVKNTDRHVDNVKAAIENLFGTSLTALT